jgi:hypothetical protein
MCVADFKVGVGGGTIAARDRSWLSRSIDAKKRSEIVLGSIARDRVSVSGNALGR